MKSHNETNSTPTLPPTGDESRKRVETLAEWQKTSDEQINRLLILILVIVILYSYYGFVSPWITAWRLQELGKDRADLERVTQQFKNLRDRYSFLVLPAVSSGVQAAEDIGLFVDVIIPAVSARLEKNEQEIVTHTAQATTLQGDDLNKRLDTIRSHRETLDSLKDDMVSLSALYNEHRNRHPSSAVGITNVNQEVIRGYLGSYRSSVSSLLFGSPSVLSEAAKSQAKSQPPDTDRLRDKIAISDLQALLLGQSDAHLGIENDPVNNLECLIQLETVIKHLKSFDATNVNSTLCEEARLELAERVQFRNIRLGDTLTKSFHPYSKLSEYTAPSTPFSLSATTELETYRAIAKDLGAPFEVTTLSDLYRLDEYANTVIDKTNAENESMVLNIPFLDVTIDRFVVLMTVPAVVVLFLHVILVHLRRSCRLIKELENDRFYNVSLSDHIRYSPHNVLVSEVFEAEATTGKKSTKHHLAKTAKWSILAITLLLPVIFVWNSYRTASRFMSLQSGASVLIGLITAAFLTFEVLSITRFVRNNYRAN